MRVRGVAVVIMAGVVWLPAVAGGQDVFKIASSASTAGRPSGIVVGDFDEIAPALDAVVANSDDGSVTFLLGFADGTLSNLDSFAAGNLPSALVAGDFDGDTHLDLVIANVNDAQVVFLQGGGDGTFAPPGDPVSVAASPTGLAADDFDGDGNLDLAVACEGATETSIGTVNVLRGGGDGTFTVMAELVTGQGTRGVAIGRVDGDAQLDIVAVNAGTDSVSVFFATAAFSFTAATTLTTGRAPLGVALGDLNGDGTRDIITADSNDDTVSVLIANADRSFRPRAAFPVGTVPDAVAVGDLSGDGRADVVASNNRSGDVSVLLGDGSGSLARARTFVASEEPLAVALGDFDDDDRPDVVTANSTATVWVLTNDGGGALRAPEDLPAGSGPAKIAAGDLDGDALPDLVVAHTSGEVLAFRAQAGGGFDPAELLLTTRGDAADVAVIDVNGDAILDLAVVDRFNPVDARDDVRVMLGRGGGAFGPATAFAVANDAVAITSGDFNRDRIVDLAVASIGPPGAASVLIGRGDGTFADAIVVTDGIQDTPVAVAAGDFNCDGADDLLVANHASDTVSLLVNNRDGTFTARPSLSGGGRPAALVLTDFNRDGHPDLAVGNSSNTRVFLGRAQPCDATFAFQRDVGSGIVFGLVARDFQRSTREPAGSRFVDLGVVLSNGNAVQLIRGVGDGTFSGSGSYGVSRMPVGIAAADFDGDGRYDAATANGDPSANNVSVLTNSAAPPALRGDGNDDGRVSAADVTALLKELTDGDGTQVEDTVPFGFPAAVGIDANGDGRVDRQDIGATGRRIFLEG